MIVEQDMLKEFRSEILIKYFIRQLKKIHTVADVKIIYKDEEKEMENHYEREQIQKRG